MFIEYSVSGMASGRPLACGLEGASEGSIEVGLQVLRRMIPGNE
jgi:hypothetical protein